MATCSIKYFLKYENILPNSFKEVQMIIKNL